MTCPIIGSSCATLEEIISIVPNLETFGGVSQGKITLAGLTLVGETLTIGGVTLTAVAGVAGINQWSVDGDEYAQLASIVAAINNPLGGLIPIVTASVLTPGDLTIHVKSISTGLYSQIPWATTSLAITLDPVDRLSGGECDLAFFSNMACSQLGNCWGDKKTYAHILLTAHLIEMGNGNDLGVLSSRSIDKISESFSLVQYPPKDAYWAGTKWGRMFRTLWQSVPKIPIVGQYLIPRNWPGYGRGWRGGCW